MLQTLQTTGKKVRDRLTPPYVRGWHWMHCAFHDCLLRPMQRCTGGMRVAQWHVHMARISRSMQRCRGLYVLRRAARDPALRHSSHTRVNSHTHGQVRESFGEKTTQQERAAAKMQARIRGTRARNAAERAARDRAAILLQSAYRGFTHRQEAEEWRRLVALKRHINNEEFDKAREQ